ncbi:class I adenylate-forming enzyme family protein [Longimicrobium sp.]|uniref:class I adenylate-forming enzyme family protein n=1 Tax=Longimicrobium sp. TaxID=2029185 RepID=UPI002B8CCA58|nr:AMP-binding protein [Longimicrobium sp.]HSU12739.1 AMP-binding protein [Longimicrobium sp.]
MNAVPNFPRRPDPLRFWRRLAGERHALVDRARGERLTYPELDAAADRWAALLRAQGIGRGDIVATLAGNRSEMAAAFFACGRIGAALLPLNWRLAAPELAPILDDARPRLVLGEDRFRARAEDALRGIGEARWIDLDAAAPALLARGGPSAGDVEVDAEDPWLVLYTSGSTGRPKGAILPHRQIFYNAVATTTAWELGAGDVAPVSTPFFHTGGWNVFATPLWFRGGKVVLFDQFDADSYMQGIRDEGITVALTVPTMLLMLMEGREWGSPLPSLRTFMSGGAPLPAALAERVRAAGYRLREGYGLTECGPNCFAMPADQAVRRPGVVGWPVPMLEMRVEREDGTEAAPGEPGELLLRGPQVFAGYLRNPEKTAEAFTEDGWLRTGDLAAREADGAFRICGRRKEMFISGGENVFPGEVEAALADCPGVAEVVVVGVRDERWGEVGRAFIVPRGETRLTEVDVVTHARARLAGYKVPRSVVFLPEIPRLGSGKPDRRALAEARP